MKKPSLRPAWIALLMLVVTVCVYIFGVIGAKRQQIEAVATQLPDPRRDTDGPLGAAPIATTLARAERHSITETLAVTGSLVAREEIVVGTELDGLRIVDILADVGDRVEQGQVLARLDATMLRIQLAQNTSMIAIAEASIAQMKASIAEAQATEAEAADALKRTQTLGATGTTSPVQLLARETQAKVAAAKATSAEENAVVSLAGEPLFRLVRNSEIEFDAEVPETMLPQIVPGQNVEVWLAGVGEAIGGYVRLVDPTVDKMSRLGRVAVALSSHPDMRAGIFARGNITLGRRQAVTVPLSAVLFGKDGTYVQLATNNVVEIRNVETGFKRGTRVEIVNGLIEGQEVVVRAAAFARPGERIMPVRSDAKAAGGD